MSGSVRYEVVLAFRQDGRLGEGLGELGAKANIAHAGIQRVRDVAGTVGDAVERMGSRAAGALGAVVEKASSVAAGLAKVGALAGIAAATYGVVGLNASLEQTQLGLAALFTGNGLANNFEQGMTGAREQVALMKQDIKSLPGDLSELANIMQTITGPAAQGGAHADDIRKLSGKALLFGAGISGLDAATVARESAGLLTGRAGGHNVLGSRLGLIGAQAAAFNADSPEKRLQELTKALDKQLGGSAEAFGKSWKSQWTTLKDDVKFGFLQPVTKPLFDTVKADVVKLNAYFDANHEKIERFATVAGTKLAHGFDMAAHAVERMEPVVKAIAGYIEHLDGTKLKAFAIHGAEAYALGKVAPLGISLASSVAGRAISAGGSMFAGGGAAEGLAGVGAGGLAASAALPLAAAALVGFAAVAVGTVGAVNNLTEADNQYHDAAVKHVESMKANVEAFSTSMAQATRDLKEAVKPAVDGIGEAFLIMGDNAAHSIRFLADQLHNVTSLYAPNDHPNSRRDGEDLGLYLARMVNTGKMSLEEARYAARQGMKQNFGGWVPADSKSWESLKSHHSVTNITQHNTITVQGSADPSRVARMTMDEIKKLTRHPTKSPHVTDWSKGG